MTKKTTLIEWGYHLGVVSNAQQGQDMTAAQLEQGISQALVERNRAVAQDDDPQYTFRDGIRNNWAVIQAEAIPTVKAIAANLRS